MVILIPPFWFSMEHLSHRINTLLILSGTLSHRINTLLALNPVLQVLPLWLKFPPVTGQHITLPSILWWSAFYDPA